MFEIKAIEMINRYLETAVNEPGNADARNGMAVAQYIAGMAFSNVGLGVVHGMAHPLGAIFDIPHGVANALLLPTIMEFNAPAALDKYVDIAKALNVYSAGMSKEEAARCCRKSSKGTVGKSRYPSAFVGTRYQGRRPSGIGKGCICRCMYPRKSTRSYRRNYFGFI